MHLQFLTIHNFRSIKHQKIFFKKYSCLIGENNSGKSNIIRAIRIFYEDGIKYDSKKDFPRFKELDDNECWIEMEYITTEDEQEGLKNEYKTNDKILKVRKYLKTDNINFKEKVKANQSNIFAYENGELSTNYFYGAKNISLSKLGNIIFIPEISRIEDNLKLSGPSPLRNMINHIMKKVVKGSNCFNELQKAFEKFNNEFREEQSMEGYSINQLEKNVTDYNKTLEAIVHSIYSILFNNKNKQCPFFNYCDLPNRKKSHIICKCSPWSLINKKENCWYNNGLATIIYEMNGYSKIER